MCPLRGAAPQGQPGRGRAAPPQVPTVALNPAFNGEPELRDQIRPLNCPRAAPLLVGHTFYGGNMCAPMPAPSLAAGEQLPWDWRQAGTQPAGPQPGTTQTDGAQLEGGTPSLLREPSPPTKPSQPAEPPPPKLAAADLNKAVADNYWQHLWQTIKNSPVATGVAVGGPAAFAAGFALARYVPW